MESNELRIQKMKVTIDDVLRFSPVKSRGDMRWQNFDLVNFANKMIEKKLKELEDEKTT